MGVVLLLTAFCLEVRTAGLRSCSPFSVSLEMSSSDSSQDEENPAEEAEEDDSFRRERLEELGLELRLGAEDRPWSDRGSSEAGWHSGPMSVIMTAGMEGMEGGMEGAWLEAGASLSTPPAPSGSPFISLPSCSASAVSVSVAALGFNSL